METLKKYFPLSFKRTETAGDLVVGILIYLVIGLACGVVSSIAAIIAIIPLIGWIIGIVVGLASTVAGLYILAGIVIQILVFAKVIKEEEKPEE